ncbi:phage tail tape measure protein [Pseudomonas monteilii]|uniref:phage tail tape measure protein n=1 Tax=Pseudomonas monteilii TaxID=76759 RepID=UPI00383A9D6C
MANNLRLQVLLSAIDKATGPLRKINQGSTEAGRALKTARDRLKELNGQQKDVSAWRAQLDETRKTTRALGAAQERVKALARQMNASAAPTQAMAREMRTAVREAQSLSQQQQRQSATLQQLRTRLQGTGLDTRNLSSHERQLRTQLAASNSEISTQTRRLSELAAQQRRAAQAKSDLARAQQRAGSMAATGAAGLATGGGALYAGVRLVQPGLRFDADMSKVQALTRLDKNSNDYKQLRKQARDLGAATQFTATDAAQGQGYLAMAGFDPKAIRQAMPGMLDLAKAGDSGLAETADIASNILSGMKLQSADMGRLGDVLVGTFTRSNTNLQMLGETMKYVAPIASGVGQDIETVAAMSGKLADNAMQGSIGGTALRSILSRLSAPPKVAADALQELGINAKDAQGNLRDVPTILEEIYERTRHMGGGDRVGILKDIAGMEAVGAMQVLVDEAGAGKLQSFIQTLKQSQGEARQTAKVMGDNLAGDIDALTSAWQDLGIELEEQQDGPLRSIVQTIAGVVRGIKAWAVENPGLASGLVKALAVILTIVAAMGALTIALASVLGPFALIRYGLAMFSLQGASLLPMLGGLASVLAGKLLSGIRIVSIALWGLAANPVVLVIAAIVAALAGAAYLIYRNWDDLRAGALKIWNSISETVDSSLSRASAALAAFDPMTMLQGAFTAALDYLNELPARFSNFGSMIIDGLVNGLTSGLGRVKDSIASLGDSTIGWFKEKLDIHSPSRVFAELGGFTTDGLAMGLADGSKTPLETIKHLGQQLAQAGAFTLNGAIPALAGTQPITLDGKPPISAASAAASYDSHDQYEINIHPSPSMDSHAIARAVRAELARIENEKAARRRSRLSDQE